MDIMDGKSVDGSMLVCYNTVIEFQNLERFERNDSKK